MRGLTTTVTLHPAGWRKTTTHNTLSNCVAVVTPMARGVLYHLSGGGDLQ